MPTDGEAMRLVAHLLQQVKRRRICWQTQLLTAVWPNEDLQTRLARHPLGNAVERHFLQPELGEHPGHDLYLPAAAVDEQEIRQHGPLALAGPEAAAHRLCQRRVVVARRDVADVVTAIGAARSAYRRYNISDITPGDDYAALAQAVRRRFRTGKSEGAVLPDLLLIDGGRGQVQIVAGVLAELGLEEMPLYGIAKGVTRKPGLEVFIRPDSRQELRLPADSPALHLLQQVRDEAHRFAIGGHRARRGKARTQSQLEGIDGLGPTRRRALLQHFGGITQVRAASIDALTAVPGISRRMAERIHTQLR